MSAPTAERAAPEPESDKPVRSFPQPAFTDAVDRRESDLSEAEVYLCGPPPMVDAAMAMLEGKTVARERIYFDKFTTTVPQA